MVRLKAEWEEQKTVWLSWPHNEKHWGSDLESLRSFYITFIQMLLEFQEVSLLVPSEDIGEIVKQQCETSGRVFELKLFCIETDDIWIRDYGPVFMENDGQSMGIDFQFNAWGEKYPPWDHDNAVASKILQTINCKKIESSIVAEGGNLEGNGRGILLTVEESLFAQNRNPNLTTQKMEDWLCQNMAIHKVLWLPYGLACDHTDGHIDNIARFIDENTIIHYLPEHAHSEYSKMAKNIEYIERNSSFTVIPCPFMHKMSHNGVTLPSGYLNFIYVNNGVIIPQYNGGVDEAARNFFCKLFAGRNVKFIDIRPLIIEGGGLHCMTKNQ